MMLAARFSLPSRVAPEPIPAPTAARRGASLLLLLVAASGLCASAPALAHHGLGRFDRSKVVDFTGTIAGIDFVNPHSYLHFKADTADGRTIDMRCEMRAATLLRRSGWSAEMFVVGAKAVVHGYAHRDDPASCYLEDITIGAGPRMNRNDQFTTQAPDLSKRPARLASGEPNISGDWAQEQYVIAVNGAGLVPKSMVADVRAGKIKPADVPASGWSPQPVTLTPRGQAEADAFRMWSPEDNPRLRCRPTSIILDWVFDGPVNRIAQQKDRIIIDYGLYSFERVIHMDTDEHPANLVPSYAGHSIGRWDGDTLVVDTIGFEPGVLVAPIRHSDRLHVVERFTLDPQTVVLHRSYVAEDPVYFVGQYAGSDTVLVADVPYEPRPCKELTPEFSPQQPRP
jgi:hypothetical protein